MGRPKLVGVRSHDPWRAPHHIEGPKGGVGELLYAAHVRPIIAALLDVHMGRPNYYAGSENSKNNRSARAGSNHQPHAGF